MCSFDSPLLLVIDPINVTDADRLIATSLLASTSVSSLIAHLVPSGAASNEMLYIGPHPASDEITKKLAHPKKDPTSAQSDQPPEISAHLCKSIAMTFDE